MKKEKKFLEELDRKLVGINKKEKQSILLKYQDIIKTRKDNKERIKDILKTIGTVDEVAKTEIEAYKNKKSFKYRINKIFHGIKTFVINDWNKDKEKEKKNKEEKELKKEERKQKKLEKAELRKLRREEKKKLKEDNKKIKAEQKKLLKEEKAKTKAKKKCKCCGKRVLDKDNLYEVCPVCGWESDKLQEDNPKMAGGANELSLKEYRKKYKKENTNKKSFKDFLNKFKKKKTITEEIKEEVEEIKEEFSDEISQVTDIATETRMFETKEERRRRVTINTIKVIITTLLIFLWLWVTVVFIASVFGYLDGVKFYGLVIGLFGLDFLVLQVIIFINKSLFTKKINRKWPFIFILISVLIMAVGIALALRQIYQINTTSDVSEKYSMTKKISSYNLSSDTNKKLYISFNANYNTEYIVEYDNTLNNKINVEVKYYECYYDYFVKKDNNNIYISLRLDKRDRLSVYIDDFKEGKIYDNNELSRYVVKITLNERDKDRVIVK